MALDMVATQSPKLQRTDCTHEVTFLSPPKYVRKASADSVLSGRRKLPKSPSRNSPLLDFTTSRPEYDGPHSADSETSLGTAKDNFDVFTFTETEIELEGRLTDRRISDLKSQCDIPNNTLGYLRKANSLSEFQDHPELQLHPIIDSDSVSLTAPRCPSREDPTTPRGGLSPSNSYETIRRVQTFNDRQEKPTMELRRISTINLPPTDTCSIEFLLVPDLNIGSCLSMDGIGKSLDSEVWQETVSQEVVSSLSERETNRQSAIHELIWTEQNHLFTLRVMLKIFSKGMKDALHISDSNLEVLFPKIEELLLLSERFLMSLLNLRSEEQKMEFIGATISDFFCGECRDSLKRCFGHFIRKQTIALISYKDMLKSRQFSIFIQKCESMPECRRKTLPDCYLLISQRLTKYISLMERIYKYTDKEHKDYECLQDAIEEVKEIVQSINDELTEEQNRDFLNRITANYDSAIIKANGKVKKFDIKLRFNGRKLKTHGKTMWYINQGKHTVSLETTILLFNDSIFMLLEKDNRYYVPQIGDLNLPFIYLKHLLVKPNAVDKKSIFIINTEKSAAEMYRLMFETSEEAIRWQGDIAKSAADISKVRGVIEIPFFEQNKEKEKKISKKSTHSFNVKSDQSKSKQKPVSFEMINECDQKINAELLKRDQLIYNLYMRNNPVSLESNTDLSQREEFLYLQHALKSSQDFLQSRMRHEDKTPALSYSQSLRKISSPEGKPPKPRRKGTSHEVPTRSNWYLSRTESDCSMYSIDDPPLPSLDSSMHSNELYSNQGSEEEHTSTGVQLVNTVSNLMRIIIDQDTILRRNNIPITESASSLVRQNSTRSKFNKATQNYLQKFGVSSDKKSKTLERRHTLHDSILTQEQLQLVHQQHNQQQQQQQTKHN